MARGIEHLPRGLAPKHLCRDLVVPHFAEAEGDDEELGPVEQGLGRETRRLLAAEAFSLVAVPEGDLGLLVLTGPPELLEDGVGMNHAVPICVT